jgi:FkbM family methyltransferase
MSELLQRGLARIARSLPPPLGLRLEVARAWRSMPELQLAARLCQPDRGAIDIGANNGLFSWAMSRRAAWCAAFEPNPACVRLLSRAMPDLRLIDCALGEKPGQATLAIPVVDGIAYHGYGSLAATSALAEHPRQEIEISVRTLDSFAWQNVGFIKIDVEGYEEAVLRGGINCIETSRPILMVELEERHNPGGRARVTALLGALGYGEGEAVQGAENNFVFRPATQGRPQ